MSAPAADHPGVVARPPRLLLGFVALGLALDFLWPAPFLPYAWQYALGGSAIAIAFVLFAGAATRFRRAGTNIPTPLPATALVTEGPYRYSRNPIYVALTMVFVGIGLAVDSVWLVALVVPFVAVIRYGVIAREERYLEAKFGDGYRDYRTRVRRWI